MESVFNMAPTGKKSSFKATARNKYGEAMNVITEIASALTDMVIAAQADMAKEAWDELLDYERDLLKARMSEEDRIALEDLIRE